MEESQVRQLEALCDSDPLSSNAISQLSKEQLKADQQPQSSSQTDGQQNKEGPEYRSHVQAGNYKQVRRHAC